MAEGGELAVHLNLWGRRALAAFPISQLSMMTHAAWVIGKA